MVNQFRVNRNERAIKQAQRREMLRTGTVVRFTPSRRCSCLDFGAQPQIDCRVCGGSGWFYIEAEERRERAIVMDAHLNRLWQGYGFLQQGDIGVVFDRRMIVKPRDRVRLAVDDLQNLAIVAEQEIVRRDADDSGSMTDLLRHRILAVEAIFSSDPRSGATARYRPGIDFTVPPNNNAIVWSVELGTMAPLRGEQYSVSYRADYDWIALQDAAPRHAGGAGFGAASFFSRQVSDERANDARREEYYG